jgi:hypothetical protein
MPNTILNDPAAGNNAADYAVQARPDKGDVDAWIAGFSGTGVVSGAAVTSSGSLGLSVAAGTILRGGVQSTVSGSSLTLATADTTNPRTDLVVWTFGTGYQLIAGTPAASPVWPSFNPTTQVLLAMVVVPAAAGSVSSANIVDKRVVILPTASSPSRQTASHVTTSLLAFGSATGTQEQSSISLAKSYRLLSVTTSVAARVRLYDRASKQAADATRAIGNRPTGDHGLMFEFVGSPTLLSCDVSPPAIGSSMETTPTVTIPLTVDNLSATSGAITVTMLFFAQE